MLESALRIAKFLLVKKMVLKYEAHTNKQDVPEIRRNFCIDYFIPQKLLCHSMLCYYSLVDAVSQATSYTYGMNQLTSHLTTDFSLVLVVSGVLLQVANLHAAANLGVDSSTKNRDSNWHLLVAWKSSGDDKLADLELSIDDRAAVALKLRTTADEREARGARFAADFTLQAAES